MKNYSGRNLDLVSYPMGGLGAGMVCLQGTGCLGSVSVRNKPDVQNEPLIFSAVTLLGEPNTARVLEAPVPPYKLFMRGNPTGNPWQDAGNGLGGTSFGLPRFASGEFSARFPFATVGLTDGGLPLAVSLTGWSPFVPGEEDRSSLPLAALEYTFTNTGAKPLEAVYHFCAENFMKLDDRAQVRAVPNGFVLDQPADPKAPHVQGAFCASVDEEAAVDAAWFRGGWFDTLTMLWKSVEEGRCEARRHADPENGASRGGRLSVRFRLLPGECKTVRVHLSWYVPGSELSEGGGEEGCCPLGSSCCCAESAPRTYRPWYSSRLSGIDEANNFWLEHYAGLRAETLKFTEAFHASTLPEELLEAVSANLSILKSPTVLRQWDGRLWGWEGCHNAKGCCPGSCTHVWNYAQAICNLFPRLERSLRETEFLEAQDDETGHQNFRASLPIRKSADHSFHAAGDGQLGGVMKAYRDWRISGDSAWLKKLWPRIRRSLDFCIALWDTGREGVLKQPHHNTYDIEFWGPDGMCMSFYLGALKAAAEMGEALGEDCAGYRELYARGRAYLEENLFNGEYFYQRVMWKELEQNAGFRGISESFDPEAANGETRALLLAEGPKYQYGPGCLSDGVLGVWLAEVCGLADIVDESKLKRNLLSIHRYNFKADLSAHANTQRPGYAAGKEASLLLCTWPRGGKPCLPFVYSDEVWTGIEYQVASHLILKGYTQEGMQIVRACRARYGGDVRNPYDEYECGHWYARAMASYALLQAWTGVRYDSLTKTLHASLANAPYKTFLSTETGFGTVEARDGAVTVDVVSGRIDVRKIELT